MTADLLYPGFLFLYFVARRQWNAVFAGALAFGMLTGRPPLRLVP